MLKGILFGSGITASGIAAVACGLLENWPAMVGALAFFALCLVFLIREAR